MPNQHCPSLASSSPKRPFTPSRSSAHRPELHHRCKQASIAYLPVCAFTDRENVLTPGRLPAVSLSARASRPSNEGTGFNEEMLQRKRRAISNTWALSRTGHISQTRTAMRTFRDACGCEALNFSAGFAHLRHFDCRRVRLYEMEPALPEAPPTRRRRRRIKKEVLAVLLSVVATAVVIIQRFIMEHTQLLLPSQTMALESSVRATKVALSKLQMILAVAKAVSAAESEEQERGLRNGGEGGVSRRRPKGSWFEEFRRSGADDAQWRHNFRMARVVFLGLLETLRPSLERVGAAEIAEDGGISAEVKLAAALYRLAHGASLRAVAKRFGMSNSAASGEAFGEVCRALEARLSNLFDFPSEAAALNPIIERFAQQGMPNCCGVVGCTRFPVEGTASNAAGAAAGYYDSGGEPSVVMQGVVDAACRFLDISVGWGGSLLPAEILPGTRLYLRVVSSRELLHGRPVELLNGIPLPEYIIGDSSYPLLPWLLTPYVAVALSPPQVLFNGVHDHVRATVSKAFGMLKGHWQLLSTATLRVDDVPFIVAAACILHNFLINSGEPMPALQELLAPGICQLAHFNKYAESIRDALADHLSAVARMQIQLP